MASVLASSTQNLNYTSVYWRTKNNTSPEVDAIAIQRDAGESIAISSNAGSTSKNRLLLLVATGTFLLPFLGKAFNIDDPLFVWVAKHVVHHPLDPYGFSVDWYVSEMPISQITKNPPLAGYYSALIGPWTHWSEFALHLAFLLPALAVILGTFELARSLTLRPVLAAFLTLATPAFLVSATSVMCDVSMLAVWILSILAWRKGLCSERSGYLLVSSVLMAVCALTKYFGISLVPLLLAYSIVKKRRLGLWALYFLVPIAIMMGYQLWTKELYGQGLFFGAAHYEEFINSENSRSFLGNLLIGLSFLGGCMLPAVLFAPLLFRRTWLALGLAIALPAAVALAWNVVTESNYVANRSVFAAHLAIFIAGGVFVLMLAAGDLWQRRDAESVFLSAWVLGTFIFAAYLNWTINARSILPLVPAAGILIARRLDLSRTNNHRTHWIVTVPLILSAFVSLWLTFADVSLANSARTAARMIHAKTKSSSARVFFSGHWGFQYYMEAQGARPAQITKQNEVTSADIMVQPENNTNPYIFPRQMIASEETIEIDINHWISPLRREMGAGFYSRSGFGPLPFAVGRVPPERYTLLRLRTPSSQP